MAVKELSNAIIRCTLSSTVARTLAHCYVLERGRGGTQFMIPIKPTSAMVTASYSGWG